MQGEGWMEAQGGGRDGGLLQRGVAGGSLNRTQRHEEQEERHDNWIGGIRAVNGMSDWHGAGMGLADLLGQ